jgi:hypothetical protein
MTTRQDLIDLVELQPWNQTFADILHEYLVFDEDMTWSEGLRHVEQVRVSALREWQLQQARTELMPRARYRGRIHARMKAVISVMWSYTELIIVVEGDSDPMVVALPDGHPEAANSDLAITVGAAWVLATVVQIKEEWASYQAARKSSGLGRRKKGGHGR